MNATNRLKRANLITKINLFIIFIIIQLRLLDMIDTVSDKLFSVWLAGTILCAMFVILFGAWIVETIINWNKQ